MKYEQLLIKAFHYIRQRPALVVVTILMATAPWLQTTLQGTVDWTGKGISVQWNTLPNPYSLIFIGTITILWMAYRLTHKFQPLPQES